MFDHKILIAIEMENFSHIGLNFASKLHVMPCKKNHDKLHKSVKAGICDNLVRTHVLMYALIDVQASNKPEAWIFFEILRDS